MAWCLVLAHICAKPVTLALAVLAALLLSPTIGSLPVQLLQVIKQLT